jgi:hypothetical protein
MLSGFEDAVVIQLFVVVGQEPDKYAALKALGESNPFYKNHKRIIGKRAYFEWLEEQPGKHLLGEDNAPRLEQVYIFPRAYYEKKPVKSKRERPTQDEARTERYIVDLEDELNAWLDKADPKDAVRVIAGEPGSGKSSFVTMFAAKHVARGDSALVVPLHRIGHDFDSNLSEAIEHVIDNDGLLAENPIDGNDNEPWLIIFDGLDELEALENGKNVAEVFYRQVKGYILDKNYAKDKPRFNVLLSGRTLIVQSVQSQFSHEAVLELMPFYISKNYRDKNPWLKDKDYDEHPLLKHDQRKEWWCEYGKVTGKQYEGLPKELDSPDLAEITAQPLLNYLVAMSYERNHLDFSANPSLNEVYEDLLDSVFERETSKRHSTTKQLTSDTFIQFFEEVAVVVWHGNGRTATLAEIEEACHDDSEISEAINALPKKSGRLVTNIYDLACQRDYPNTSGSSAAIASNSASSACK